MSATKPASSEVPPVLFRLSALSRDAAGDGEATSRASGRPRRNVPAASQVTADSWLGLHAADLIARMTDWSEELDQREADLEGRENALQRRLRVDRRTDLQRELPPPKFLRSGA